LADRWAAEAVAAGRVGVFDELVAADAIDHSGPTDARGVEGFKLRTRAIHAAFTDVAVCVDEVLVDGEMVAWRWTLTATHSGTFLGVPGTGRGVRMTGMNFQRFVAGKVIEHWSNSDQLGLLRQVQAP
jgi:predicted ester cyclase